MGCDIHVHVEIRYKGEWVHYAAPRVSRWYRLFGVMAGVRDTEETPIVEPKGLPDDMSVVTKIDWELCKNDWHTPSWFNEEEIMRLEDWLRDHDKTLEYDVLGSYFYGNCFVGWKRYGEMESAPEGIDGVRLVFWFDN